MEARTSPVVDALVSVVRDHGLRSTEDPVRTRALLTDALGERARPLRAELDAVLIALEEDVPATLTATGQDDDRATLARTLQSRGLTPEMAAYAVAAWSAVLAPRHRGASTTSARTSTGAASAGTATAGATAAGASRGRAATTSDRHDAVLAPTELPRGTVQAGPAAPAPTPAPASAPSSSPRPDEATSLRPMTLLWSRRPVAAALAAVGMVVAFALGYLVPRGERLDAAPAASLPQATATVTTTAVPETVTSTVKVTSRVTSVVTVDATKLKAVAKSYRVTPAVVWPGQQTCTEKRAPAPATPLWCYHKLAVAKTGSLKSWKVVSAKVVSGPGVARVGTKRVDYYPTRNGAATVTIRYVILSGTVQSTSTVRISLVCIKNYPCGKALPS